VKVLALVLFALATAGCSPLADGSYRGTPTATIEGTMDLRPLAGPSGPIYLYSPRMFVLWTNRAGLRELGPSVPMAHNGDRATFRLDLYDDFTDLQYRPGWRVGYLLAVDSNRDGLPIQLVEGTLLNASPLGVANELLVYRDSLAGSPDAGVDLSSGFLVSDAAAADGYDLAEGQCATDGSLVANLYATIIDLHQQVRIIALPPELRIYGRLPQGQLPGGCLGF
jgi:hypothetical protein